MNENPHEHYQEIKLSRRQDEMDRRVSGREQTNKTGEY